MANKEKATFDQPGLEHRREITNTGGHLDRAPGGAAGDVREDEARGDDYPITTGRRGGDDAWHNRANRSRDRGEGAEPARGGNLPR